MSLKYLLEYGDTGVRGPNDPVPDTRVYCPAETLTRQSMKDECDINIIMGRYLKTGVLSHVSRDNPVFADVSDLPDYRESVERVKSADALFNSLDAGVRAKFGNDTAAFLDAVMDPGREAELVALGVLKAAEVPPEVVAKRSEDVAS